MVQGKESWIWHQIWAPVAAILLPGCAELSEFISPRLSFLISRMGMIRAVSKCCWESVNEVMQAEHLGCCLADREDWVHLAIIIIITVLITLVSFMGFKIKRAGWVNPYSVMLKHQERVNAVLCPQSTIFLLPFWGSNYIPLLPHNSVFFGLVSTIFHFGTYSTESDKRLYAWSCVRKYIASWMYHFLFNQPVSYAK